MSSIPYSIAQKPRLCKSHACNSHRDDIVIGGLQKDTKRGMMAVCGGGMRKASGLDKVSDLWYGGDPVDNLWISHEVCG